MMAWLNPLIVAVCLLVVDLSAGQPMITTPPQSIKTTRGANVTFPCGVKNLVGDQYVAWYTGSGVQITDNGTVVLTSGRPYKVEVGPSDDGEVFFNLTLNDIRNTEQPTFRCRILEQPGPTEFAGVTVRLTIEYFPAEEYPICMPAGNFTTVEGEQVQLVCQSEQGRPPVDIAWKKGNTPLQELVPMTANDILSLTYNFQVNRVDEGTAFKCRIINPVEFPGMEGICISGPLNVLYPPDDVSITQIPEGDYTAFQCSAGGNPRPTFSWSFNIPLSDSSYNISDDGQLLTQLDFLTCNTTDIIVTCEATNSQGKFTANTMLCKVPTCSANNTAFDALEGEMKTLTCTVDESVDELGWNRTDLTTGDEYPLGDPAMDMTSVEYQWVVDRGQANSLFTCVATSSSPSAQRLSEGYCYSGPLNEVFFPPANLTIVPAKKTVDGIDYETYWCSADGNPMEITYNWVINPTLNSSLYEITDSNQNLQIKGNISCETEDIRATCTATNAVGSSEAEIILCRVPTCSASLFSPTEGEKETLTCQHDVSSVDITWRQGDTIATEGQSVTELIYIFTAHRNDTYVLYTCTASSSSQPTYTGLCTLDPLRVQYPPAGITIKPISESSYLCSAAGEPTASYLWRLTPSLISNKHYTTGNKNSLLEILDLSDCETDIIATCVASNKLNTVQTVITIECKPSTEEPHASSRSMKPSTGEPHASSRSKNDETDSLSLERKVIIVIGVLLLVTTVIIVGLILYIVKYRQLASSIKTNEIPVYQSEISECQSKNAIEMVESADVESNNNPQLKKQKKTNGIQNGDNRAACETNKSATQNNPSIEVAANINNKSSINSQVINQQKAKRFQTEDVITELPTYETNLLGIGNKHGTKLVDNNEFSHTYFNPGLQMSIQNADQSDGDEFHKNQPMQQSNDDDASDYEDVSSGISSQLFKAGTSYEDLDKDSMDPEHTYQTLK